MDLQATEDVMCSPQMNVWWKWIVKDVERSKHSLIVGTIPEFTWRGTEKVHEKYSGQSVSLSRFEPDITQMQYFGHTHTHIIFIGDEMG
jgi:hypothetical protein